MNPNFDLQPETTTIVLVDFQERLADAMKKSVRAETERTAETLIRGAGVLGCRVLVTEQYPKGLGPTTGPLKEAVQQTTGGFSTVEKLDFDCTAADGFMAALDEKPTEHVILCGMETHICVLQTVLGLRAKDKKVWVAQDACCSRFKPNWYAGQRLAEQAGAVVAPVETILFLLVRRSGTPEFKEISKLVR